MAEGFWRKYLSDLFRFFPVVNDIQIRYEGRVVVRSIKRLHSLALEKIPLEFKKIHDIEKGFKFEDKAEKWGEKGGKAAYNLGFNTGEQLMIGIKHVAQLERLLAKVREKHPSLGEDIDKAEIKFQQDVEKGFFLGEKKERELYLRLNDAVMRVAERGSTDPTVMATLLQMTKTKEDISFFARFAFRFESKSARKAVSRLGREDKLIEKTIQRVEHGKVDEKRAAIILKATFNRMIDDLNIMFENTYKLWRRDFLAEIVLLRLLDDTQRVEEQSISIKEQTAPREPTLKNIEDIKIIKMGIAKYAHFLAQEFRILISKEKGMISDAKREEALAVKGLAQRRVAA